MFRPYRKDHSQEGVIPMHAKSVREEQIPFRSRKKSLLLLLSLVALFGFSFAFTSTARPLRRNLQSFAKSLSKSDPPVISTFYNTMSDSGHIWPTPIFMHIDPLIQWKQAWREAGWEPRVLTMEDAMKHPDFQYYSSSLSQIRNIKKGSYAYMCFMKWLAMAAAGEGGFMSDNDVFPLGGMELRFGVDLPNFGAFTVYQGHVPALLSGRASEWNRVAKEVLDEAIAHIDMKSYSDMLALRDLYHKNKASYIKDFRMTEFPYKEKDVINCELAKTKIAAHLSNPASNRALKSGVIAREDMSSRGKMGIEMMDQIKEQCNTDAP